MRPIATHQGVFAHPLNEFLGTEANVRILRVLVAIDGGSISVADLARLAGLSSPGARSAVISLEEGGLVRFIGVGRGKQVRLQRTHWLADGILALFRAEGDRPTELWEQLRSLITKPGSGVDSAWVEGPVATGQDKPGEPIRVAVLASAKHVDLLIDKLAPEVAKLEAAMNVGIELRAVTRADLASMSDKGKKELGSVLLLVGSPPESYVASPKPKSGKRIHSQKDARALKVAEAIAEAIRHDPTLITRALTHVLRRLESAAPHERTTQEEWKRLLSTWSASQLRHLLRDRGERATRLRQSLPFLHVLSRKERRDILGSIDEGRK